MKKISILAILLFAVTLAACVASASFVKDNFVPKPGGGETPVSDLPGETEQPETPPDPQNPPEPELPPEPETPLEPERPLFEYPDAVRGIYVTGHAAGGWRFEQLLKLVDETELNAMVIDIKDDYGNITFKLNGTPFDEFSKPYIKDPQMLLKILAEHKIYPIARIVVFKDSTLAQKYPEYSFTQNGNVWRNRRKEAFVNPFIPEVWKHNVEIAKMAAELGFQEIQFDYVRFPEGFEKKSRYLTYSMGDYTEEKLAPRLQAEWEQLPVEQRPDAPPVYDEVQARVTAVTDFVKYAYEELKPLGVKVSVDIFGYTATLPEAPGIGQNFVKISRYVDVISSMIYPSHWSFGYFNIPKPDLEPYRLVKEYVAAEKEKLAQLENPPVSRPWIQDFTATWLKEGNYIVYGKNEVEAQIRALNEGGIKEFLIWNPTNNYSEGVDYTPLDLPVTN